jgi:hypothetical protein
VSIGLSVLLVNWLNYLAWDLSFNQDFAVSDHRGTHISRLFRQFLRICVQRVINLIRVSKS